VPLWWFWFSTTSIVNAYSLVPGFLRKDVT
jgi:hypothetical protein